MVAFNNQLTTLSLYKLAIHRTISCPTCCHQNVMPQLMTS